MRWIEFLEKIETREQLMMAYLLLVELLVIFRNVSANDPHSFFWYCDFIPVLLLIGFAVKNHQMVKGIISVGLIVQVLYLLDFVMYFILGHGIGNIAETFNYSPAYTAVAFILHLTTLLSLMIVYKVKTEKKSLFYSAGLLLLMFAATLLFTPPAQNANSVYSLNFLIGFTPPYYTQMYPLIAFALVILPTYYLQKWLSEKRK